MATESTKPRVVLISLNYESFFDELYHDLLTELGSKADLQHAKTAESTVRLLSEQPHPSATLITDEALTNNENTDVWEAVLKYVRQGGTSVVMGHFSSSVKPARIKPFFAKAGLQWEAGSYHRTTLVLNQEAVGSSLAAVLPAKYSQKAVFVKNVADTDAWYHSDENSVNESQVFGPTSANIVGETPVVLTHVGAGKLGYIGDVNAEKGSDAVILAMCGFSG